MLDSLINLLSQDLDMAAAVGHAPQTALAAILCATLLNFFS